MSQSRGLRTLGVLTTFGGLVAAIDGYGPLADNAAVFVYGGTALYLASTTYDLIVVGNCARRGYGRTRPRAISLAPAVVGGAPGAVLSLRY